MRLVIDTNILISALLVERSLPAHLVDLWRNGLFDLLTSPEQIDEMKRVTRYPKIRGRLSPMLAGRLINDLRAFSLMVTQLPTVTISRDPNDNFLLATAKAGNAEFLITGDARDVLNLKTFAGTRIISVRAFLSSQGRLP